MTKHNILHMDTLMKDTKNIPKWRSSKFGGSKTIFKSIMGRVLINMVNYGGITNDIDMILTTRM